MKNKLKRYYGRKDLHFLTFSCYQRKSLLGSARVRNWFVRILAEVRQKYGFMLIGYVLMPEHVHLLISEPAKSTPCKVIQVLKQRVSRAMGGKRRRNSRGQMKLPFPEEKRGRRRFWQRRFYDFNVWSRGKLKEKREYIHANPVQRKRVQHPGEWPCSSWGFYANGESGLVKVDAMK
jgi:REP-associated tyrosine transposase